MALRARDVARLERDVGVARLASCRLEDRALGRRQVVQPPVERRQQQPAVGRRRVERRRACQVGLRLRRPVRLDRGTGTIGQERREPHRLGSGDRDARGEVGDRLARLVVEQRGVARLPPQVGGVDIVVGLGGAGGGDELGRRRGEVALRPVRHGEAVARRNAAAVRPPLRRAVDRLRRVGLREVEALAVALAVVGAARRRGGGRRGEYRGGKQEKGGQGAHRASRVIRRRCRGHRASRSATRDRRAATGGGRRP